MKKLLVGVLTVVMAGQVLAAEGKKKAEVRQFPEEFYDFLDYESINLYDYLNLSAKQREKVAEIDAETNDKIKQLIEKTLKKPFVEGLKDGKFNKDVILKIAVDNYREIMKIRLDAEEKIYNLLNKEQKKKYYEFMEVKVY